jgi:Na+-driven multidrug efflux pump
MRILTRDRSFYRTLIALAVPVALQGLITFAVTLADNLMVGTLGDAAVSGVYLGGQVQTFVQLFSGGVEGAILIIAAQYWGKRDTGHIKTIAAIALKFIWAFSLALTCVCLCLSPQIISLFTKDAEVIAAGADYLRIVCLSYLLFCTTQTLIAALRAVEVAHIGMAVSLISLVFNIAANYVLIFGKLGCPAMGVKGAAIATVISRAAETAVMIFYALKMDGRLQLRVADLRRHDKALRSDLVRFGLPLLGGNIVWNINMWGNSAILGHYGAAVITAASIANSMNALAYVGMTGLSSAVGVITGKTIGEGKPDKIREYAYTTQILFVGVGLATCLLISLLRVPFVHLYAGVTPEATELSLQFIRVLSLTMIGTCYQCACLFGLVKSGGDVSFVFINDTILFF